MYRSVNRTRRGDGILSLLPNPWTRIELPPAPPRPTPPPAPSGGRR